MQKKTVDILTAVIMACIALPIVALVVGITYRFIVKPLFFGGC